MNSKGKLSRGPWSTQRVQSQLLWDVAEQAPNLISPLNTKRYLVIGLVVLGILQEAFPGRPFGTRGYIL